MTSRTYLLTICLLTLPLGCDPAEPDSGDVPGADTKADAGGDTGVGPDGDEVCAEGYESIPDEGECWADAGCYELSDGSWCTGFCPEGSLLDDADPPQCAPIDPASLCAEGFESIVDDEECLADAACYELPDGSWCTGACPPGQELDDSEPRQCADAPFAGCLPGFEFAETAGGCLADAVCYEVVPYGWCTGECPDGGVFTMSEAGPSCV